MKNNKIQNTITLYKGYNPNLFGGWFWSLEEVWNYRGKRGKIPTAYSVSVILTRPIYCGYNTFCGELYKGNHEPIIDIKTFNRVQFLLKKQGRFSGRTKQKMYKIIPAC